MLKINLLATIVMVTILSSCGFHTPYTNLTINASIISNRNNIFANELQKHFNQNMHKILVIQVGAENQNQRTVSYTSSNEASSYTLKLSIPIKVFNHNKKLLLSKTFSANTYLSKIDAYQANRLQIEEGYQQLRRLIIKQLLRRLYNLNEN
ncbi:LPS assembly lipoprotein LptE [Candidatus Vesicomyidisocius sp. SY067_SCS001]|uniref:LPS assembly lipoprotein LptE n=1 Tax=Candidatus Vesicomyidisocius sp. SY067_SCS001 TaxID=2732590 RepID=UPI001682EA61|nr:LPS assembly lipoprotein LptE [Candidatus Vesicomyosocius sp. SY067_SCS001]